MAAGAIFAAVAGVMVARAIRSRNLQEYEGARAAYLSIVNHTVDECLSQYDRAMARLEDRIRANFGMMLNLDTQAGRLLLLDMSLAQAKEQRLRAQPLLFGLRKRHVQQQQPPCLSV